METLVVVGHHRKSHSSNGSMRFGSLPSGGFKDINCRTFESGIGLLPNPYGSHVMNRRFVPPRGFASCGKNGGKCKSEEGKKLKKPVKSSPISIDLKRGGRKEFSYGESFSLSELWAGPAYSNSPPPSSLPMPKFSLKPKRTVSLELPALESDLNLQPMPKSAPASPTRESAQSSFSLFRDDDCATKTLRRILNLDIADD